MSPAQDPLFPRLAVIGVGYMGGSLAAAARHAGMVGTITGFDPDPHAGRVARERGLVDVVAASAAEAVRDASIVVLAGPVRSLAETAVQIAGAVPAGAVVIDIGSVKEPVVKAIEATALAGRFVGCHPLAGTEKWGTASADAGIFAGKPCLVCAGPRASVEARDAAGRFWIGLGASIVSMDPGEHDEFMAAASHLPHVAAFVLAASLSGKAAWIEPRIPPAAPPTSLRDTTRVAASSPTVWRDIFLANREHLLPLVRTLEQCAAELRAALEAGDAVATEKFLDRARLCRQRLVKGG